MMMSSLPHNLPLAKLLVSATPAQPALDGMLLSSVHLILLTLLLAC
jgi:hypothetical protein